MHYLVAVAPVVKQAWAKALRDLDNVDQPSQYSQWVHDDKETQGVWAAHPTTVHPEQEEGEAEQGLPEESSQAQDVGPGCGCTVDTVGWQEDVGQQGSLSHDRVAKKSYVDDGKCPWWREKVN